MDCRVNGRQCLCVTEAEDRISTNQDDVASLKTKTNTTKQLLRSLFLNWTTWNIRPVARTDAWLAFRRRKRDPTCVPFWQKWIPEVLGEHNFPQPVLIERGHRCTWRH